MKKNICICGANLRETFQAEIIETVMKYANEYGYSVQIFASVEELPSKTASNIGASSVYDLVNYDECSGVVMFGERIKDEDVCNNIISRAKEKNIPVVSIDKHFDGCYNIGYNYSDAFEKIVRHIIEDHGCRDVFVMGGFEGNEFSEERIDVVRRVLLEKGITLEDDHIGYGDFWAVPCKRAMKKFFDSGIKLPEVFISVNDSMAITIIEELRLRGYSVPEDTFVTGFDGVDEEKYCLPRLTTAAQDNHTTGKLAVEIIDTVTNGGTHENDITIPFAVRCSQSCGCEEKHQEYYMAFIRSLMDKIDGNYQFNWYMSELREKLTLEKDIDNIYNNIDQFDEYLEEFAELFICVEKDLLSSDSDFFARIDNSNKNEDMVLFKCSAEGVKYDSELVSFNKKELLPDYKNKITGINNLIILPMHQLDEVYGYCVFYVTEGIANFNKIGHYASSLSQVFATVKQSCEMRRAFKELSAVKAEIEKLYIIDPLTGSYNRRGFYQEFAKRIKDKTSGYAIVLSADVDYLKQINDNYGHKEGDFAIVALSDTLRNAVGDNGIVARFGGDEYVAALFVDKFSDLQKIDVAEIIASFKNRSNVADKTYKLQFSYGYEIVELPMFRDIDQIIEISDSKMYEMKKQHHEEDSIESRL